VDSRETGRAPGRPRHDPIVLNTPQLVPMSDQEREVAITALAHLLRSWLEDARTPRSQKRQRGSDGTGSR